MKNLKNILLVSALSLGLIVGAVGVAGAATSTNYQQKIAGLFHNDPTPTAPAVVPAVARAVVPTIAPAAVPVEVPTVAPAATPASASASTPVTPPAKPATTAPATAAQSTQYHYNDGHSNMNPQQHQQLHAGMNEIGHNANENHNTTMSGNHMTENHVSSSHMSGGHE